MGEPIHAASLPEVVIVESPTPASAHKGSAPAKPSGLRKWLVVLAVALAFGTGWFLAGGSIERTEKESLPTETGLSPRDPAAVMVTVEPVVYRPVQRLVEGVGTLHGFEEVTLSARVEGRVQRLAFDVADRVKPGAVLLEIDPTDYDLAVQQAEQAMLVELAKLGLKELPGPDFELKTVPTVVQAQAKLENMKRKLVRAEQLRTSGSISPEELGNARADFSMGEAEHANQLLMAQTGLTTAHLKRAALAIARQQLKDAKICVPTPTVPVPGATNGASYAVTQRAVSEGTLVRAGTEVCKLVVNDTLKLRLPVPERYSSEVRVGQKAQLSMAACPDCVVGTVTRINPAVDVNTRTLEVEVQVPNPKGELKPGSFAKAAILTRVDEEAVTVPLSALVTFAGINKVYVVENGRAKEVQVTPGVQTTEWIEIARPALPRGAHVITSGQTAVAAGSLVVVRAAKEAGR